MNSEVPIVKVENRDFPPLIASSRSRWPPNHRANCVVSYGSF